MDCLVVGSSVVWSVGMKVRGRILLRGNSPVPLGSSWRLQDVIYYDLGVEMLFNWWCLHNCFSKPPGRGGSTTRLKERTEEICLKKGKLAPKLVARIIRLGGP